MRARVPNNFTTVNPAHMLGRLLRRCGATRLRGIFVCAVLASGTSACASTQTCFREGTPPDALRTIYVVQRGWHTGVAIPVADWPNKDWSVLREFPDVEILEFGWGDERFYQAETNTLWMGARAALWPTPSVVHVIGLPAATASDAQANEIVAVQVSADGLRDLAASVEREFAGAQPVSAGPQIAWVPAPNRFYEAKRSFYFPRMCNWWIAKRLQEAGCAIHPWTVVTASRVMREARGFRDGEQ